MKKTVKEVMTKEPVAVTLQDNVYEVAVKMRDHDTGFMPVIDNEDDKTLLGVITDRDLVIRGYAAKHSGSTAVEKVMSKEIQTVSEDTSVDEAAELMSSWQIRRLAVTSGQKLIGVVSIGDLAVRNIFADEAGEALHDISQQHLH
ncbi:Hypoxic response protein 1 [Paenibacillus pseudetheri]|uniref:Hypoxic response protein 1 n=2 Tax=Paenibacillus pseudetheri TaxID=2897682 RepID=A0ABN8FC83_9BACL|nr:Hypoxic response protein 1 [Paenibacillus pseudetheri]